AGNFQQAKDICTEIGKEQPDREEICFLLGIVHAQLGEYDLAIQYLERSLQLNARNADAYLAMGAAYQKKGLYDEAVNFYRKALSIDPDFAEAYENMGDIFRGKKQFDEAVTCFKKAIQYFPHSAEIHCSLGSIFREKRQYDLATFYYRTALQHNPDCAEAYRNLGIIYHEQRRLDEAIRYYQKALELSPDLVGAQMDLGDALHEKRQINEAVAYSQCRAEVALRLGFLKVEMMINAVINQFYFRTLNVQFYPDMLDEGTCTSGTKRRILENILNDIKKIEDIDKFFHDLDRLNEIWKYYENRHSDIMLSHNETRAVPNYTSTGRVPPFERLHREFMGIAAHIETQLVKVLNS
ncbi:MAG: tetratricopeptide repeat protein, partial [Thermodesulfovibrionales bacterium]|nr:tetratricopeptide repeat protein [Thermodesulfovibrionales bacterium]